MKNLKLIFLFVFAFTALQAQEKAPFYNDIQQFKKQDSLEFPPKNAVLLIGSSTFTMWKDVQSYFPKHKIINRGFGGSSLPDVINFVGDVVYPYQPKQVVIYCGENDFMVAGGIEPKTVADRAKNLIQLIRAKYPKVPIAYISIKPSPSRESFVPKMVEANQLIERMLKEFPKTVYINTFNGMLN
ncbi:MAG: G-D-S-L family lipolytic protein, partial [Pedobacter sp.]